MVLGLLKYMYYHKPDGEDLLGKTIVSVRAGVMTGIIIGATNAIYNLETASNLHRIIVGMRPVTYLAGIGFVFANVTYMCTKLRGKDDSINHGIGALATTPLVRSWLYKTPTVQFAELMVLSTLGMMAIKCYREEKSGVELPMRYYYAGMRNILPNWDYWRYWTGEETPLDDYSN